MGGLRCRACRRYVLRWPHLLILFLIGLAGVLFLVQSLIPVY